MVIETKRIEVSIGALQGALDRADQNDNGSLLDAGDRPLVVSHEGMDYFVPLQPEVLELSRKVLDEKGRFRFWERGTSIDVAVIRDTEVRLVSRQMIQHLVSLQGNNPVSLEAVATAFPNARFQEKGPTLREIGEIPLADDQALLKEALFMADGSLSLNHCLAYQLFLQSNAPVVAQLITNDLHHPNPVCHTAEAYTTSECQPDKWPTSYEKLITHAKVLIVDFSENSLPKEIEKKAKAVLEALRQAKDEHILDAIHFENDHKIRINVGEAQAVRDILAYLDQHCSGDRALACDPDEFDEISFHSGVRRSEEVVVLGGPSKTDLALALFSLMDSLTTRPLRYEFDKEEARDPALFNQKIEKPAVIANVSIPFSYLQKGIFDRAIFSYTLASAVSFLPRGNIDGSIYGNQDGKPFHQGDNEAIRGIVRWDAEGDFQVLERYTNEHGGTPPLRSRYVSTGYRSGAIAGADDIPPDEEGVYIARIGDRGLISKGATTAIQWTASWRGWGMSAMEAGVTPDVIRLERPAAALLVPPGSPPLLAPLDRLPRIVYDLVVQAPRGPHGFILGNGGKGEPGIQIEDEGEKLERGKRAIRQNRLGKNHVARVGGGYGLRSRSTRFSVGYHPYTEARFGNWILSPYLFTPVRQRTTDWPRVQAHLLVPDQQEAQVSVDLDVLYAGGGYEMFEGGRIMIFLSGGGNFSNPALGWHPGGGVVGQAGSYFSFDIHDTADLRFGYDFRGSTNEYPPGTGHHWEHFVGAAFEGRFNQSLHR